MKVLIFLGLVIITVLLVSSTAGLLAAGLALARLGADDAVLGRFLGSLLLELLLIAGFQRLMGRLRRS